MRRPACLPLLLVVPTVQRHRVSCRGSTTFLCTSSAGSIPDDEASVGGKFGSFAYWNDVYSNTTRTPTEFSWYSGWDVLEPFLRELIPDPTTTVLLPGVGNDPLLRDLYVHGGYRNLAAFDYAPAGVACAQALLEGVDIDTVPIVTADARDLSDVYPEDGPLFGAVIDKGTLDAIYLSGGKDKVLGRANLDRAVRELARVTANGGGMFLSITAACTDAVQASFHSVLEHEQAGVWEEVRNGDFYSTEDGYTSNNIDGTLLAWRKK